MTKREETIEQLTKGMSPGDKQKLIEFWSGKSNISGAFWRKYQHKIEEYDRIMKNDSLLNDFLKETGSPYRSRLDIGEPGQQLTRGK